METFDAALLRDLQADGRAKFSDLAKVHGTGRSVVAARVNHLLASGEIRVQAAIHPRMLGLETQAHLAIRVAGDTSAVARCLDGFEATVYISETTGSHQLVAEVRTHALAELSNIIATVRAVDGVLDVEVLIYERIIRSFFLGEEPSWPDCRLTRPTSSSWISSSGTAAQGSANWQPRLASRSAPAAHVY